MPESTTPVYPERDQLLDLARVIVNQLGDSWGVPVAMRQATNDANDQWVRTMLANAGVDGRAIDASHAADSEWHVQPESERTPGGRWQDFRERVQRAHWQDVIERGMWAPADDFSLRADLDGVIAAARLPMSVDDTVAFTNAVTRTAPDAVIRTDHPLARIGWIVVAHPEAAEVAA